MSDVIIRGFIKETNEAIERQTRKVVSGGLSGFDEYREVCGEIRGYKRSLENFLAVVKKYKTEDNDDSEAG